MKKIINSFFIINLLILTACQNNIDANIQETAVSETIDIDPQVYLIDSGKKLLNSSFEMHSDTEIKYDGLSLPVKFNIESLVKDRRENILNINASFLFINYKINIVDNSDNLNIDINDTHHEYAALSQDFINTLFSEENINKLFEESFPSINQKEQQINIILAFKDSFSLFNNLFQNMQLDNIQADIEKISFVLDLDSNLKQIDIDGKATINDKDIEILLPLKINLIKNIEIN